MLNADVRRILDGTTLAHIATVGPDGAPHSSPVWIGANGDRIVFFTGPTTRKARNLRADPRVALSMTSAENPLEPLIVRGRVVEWRDGDAGWAVIDDLSQKYQGGPYPREMELVVAVVEPEVQKVGLG